MSVIYKGINNICCQDCLLRYRGELSFVAENFQINIKLA